MLIQSSPKMSIPMRSLARRLSTRRTSCSISALAAFPFNISGRCGLGRTYFWHSCRPTANPSSHDLTLRPTMARSGRCSSLSMREMVYLASRQAVSAKPSTVSTLNRKNTYHLVPIAEAASRLVQVIGGVRFDGVGMVDSNTSRYRGRFRLGS